MTSLRGRLSRLAYVVSGGLAVAVLSGGRAMPPLQDLVVRTGEVAEVRQDGLVISDADGRRFDFDVPATTPITLDGHTAELRHLRAGDAAQVASTEDAVAQIIEVSTK